MQNRRERERDRDGWHRYPANQPTWDLVLLGSVCSRHIEGGNHPCAGVRVYMPN